MPDLPIEIPVARALKPLAEHVAEVEAARSASEPSGVACSDFVRAPVVKTFTRQVSRQVEVELEPALDPVTFEFMSARKAVADVVDEVVVEEIVQENVGPCPGEMLWDTPRKEHPQLSGLVRARCSVCGWRGWV